MSNQNDPPSYENSAGKNWQKNGVLHRDNDLPAIEFNSGEKNWYQHGAKHRIKGPAIINKYHHEWYRNDKRHRLNAPAIIVLQSLPSAYRLDVWWIFGTPQS